jgi:hypothetical protein
MKFFVMKNFAVFGEFKRIWSSHGFTYSGSDIKPPGYSEQWSLATNVLVGGVALLFRKLHEGSMPFGAYYRRTFSSCSSSVLQLMQRVVTGRAFSRG